MNKDYIRIISNGTNELIKQGAKLVTLVVSFVRKLLKNVFNIGVELGLFFFACLIPVVL